MEYNPGWNSSSVNLLHVRAVGPEDTLHYVWSSIGAPSVLLVATRSPSSALRVNWTQLLSPSPAGAVWIDPPDSVVYSTAVVFTKLFEFSEAKPLGELFYPTYDLSEFSWESLNHTLNRTALTAELRGVPASDPGGAFANGSLAFRVRHRQGARQGAGGTSKGQGAHPGGRELVQRAEGTFRGQGTCPGGRELVQGAGAISRGQRTCPRVMGHVQGAEGTSRKKIACSGGTFRGQRACPRERELVQGAGTCPGGKELVRGSWDMSRGQGTPPGGRGHVQEEENLFRGQETCPGCRGHNQGAESLPRWWQALSHCPSDLCCPPDPCCPSVLC
uniref:GLMPB protein n=1 Tax=Junco hyemalis TaxID=40217 RepID=A0A8C5J3R7_JUNHY